MLSTFWGLTRCCLAGALEMAARARLASLGRSKWPLKPARSRRGARNGRSSPLQAAGALEMAARARLGAAKTFEMAARACLGAAVAFEMAARTRLGATGALEMAARARLGAARALQLAARACLGAAVAFKNYVRNDCSEKLPLFGCSLNHFALLNFSSCMDMHGFMICICMS